MMIMESLNERLSLYYNSNMGCAPTNRKRSTVPAAEAKPSRSSFLEKGDDREEKENITSIENFNRLPSQHREKEKEKEKSFRSGNRVKGSSRNKIETFEDIVIKDERRGFAVEAMDF